MHTVGDGSSEAPSGSVTGVLFYGDKETVSVWSRLEESLKTVLQLC